MRCYFLRWPACGRQYAAPRTLGPRRSRESRDPVSKAQEPNPRLRGMGPRPLDPQTFGTDWAQPLDDSPIVNREDGGSSAARRQPLSQRGEPELAQVLEP